MHQLTFPVSDFRGLKPPQQLLPASQQLHQWPKVLVTTEAIKLVAGAPAASKVHLHRIAGQHSTLQKGSSAWLQDNDNETQLKHVLSQVLVWTGVVQLRVALQLIR
jgi:hypothetical protein